MFDRLSIKRVICDKTKETATHVIIPYERVMYVALRHEELLARDVPFHVKFCVKMNYSFKNAEFHSIFASAAIPSEKVLTIKAGRSISGIGHGRCESASGFQWQNPW